MIDMRPAAIAARRRQAHHAALDVLGRDLARLKDARSSRREEARRFVDEHVDAIRDPSGSQPGKLKAWEMLDHDGDDETFLARLQDGVDPAPWAAEALHRHYGLIDEEFDPQVDELGARLDKELDAYNAGEHPTDPLPFEAELADAVANECASPRTAGRLRQRAATIRADVAEAAAAAEQESRPL